jgi:hypothetical protein
MRVPGAAWVLPSVPPAPSGPLRLKPLALTELLGALRTFVRFDRGPTHLSGWKLSVIRLIA